MQVCDVCKLNQARYVCKNVCGAVYCSKQCALVPTGDFIDELPEGAAIEFLSKLTFKELMNVLNASVNSRYQRYITTSSFKKRFVVSHKGEWNKLIAKWILRKQFDYLTMWLPTLLETGALIPTNHMLLRASMLGNDLVVRLLLEDGRVDPTFKNNIILRMAVENGSVEIVRLLLADGRVNVNDAVIKTGKTEEIKQMMRNYKK